MSFHSSNDAPLSLAARRDVLATAIPVAGRSMWMVKDPITLEHHELGETEYLLLRTLDQPASLNELKKTYEQTFAPRTIQPAEIQSHLGQLHRAGLLIARGEGQAAALAERASDRRAARLRWSWMELLAFRLPGVNPDRWLDALAPVGRLLLNPLAIFFYLVLVLSALGLIISQASTFVARLPALDALVAPSNWPWLVLVVAIVKVLHELAHALVAKRMGAEVHEAGILLLVLVPTLYCDVTDIWKLPSKWQRMAVSAAGMGAELVIAAVATFIWWNSEPGVVNMLAMNVMVVCTVGTLLVNANPLMRYDGYYLLADLVDVPNLWQRSREAWRSIVTQWFFHPAKGIVKEPSWIAVYGGLSSIYMTFVLATIFWTLLIALRPNGLGVLAYGLGCVMIASVVIAPARELQQTLSSPIRRRQFRPIASSVVMLVFAVGLAILWRWPIADRVECPARVAATGLGQVVATLPGRLEMAVAPGNKVAKGDIVATLASDQISLTGQQLQGELKLAELEVEQLEALRIRDPEANAELPVARAAAKAARDQLQEHQVQADRLVLRAPSGGIVMPPPRKQDDVAKVTLASWSGSPLEKANVGAWIESGTMVAVIADPETREINLAIDETDIEIVQPGQKVRIQLHGIGAKPLVGTIRDVAQMATDTATERPEASRWGASPAEVEYRYEARVTLDNPAIDLPLESGGRAKIEAGQTTFGNWAIRELRDAFRLP